MDLKKFNPLQMGLFQYLALSMELKKNTRSLINREFNEILLYHTQIDIHGEKIPKSHG